MPVRFRYLPHRATVTTVVCVQLQKTIGKEKRIPFSDVKEIEQRESGAFSYRHMTAPRMPYMAYFVARPLRPRTEFS